jgi:hypothetical protein
LTAALQPRTPPKWRRPLTRITADKSGKRVASFAAMKSPTMCRPVNPPTSTHGHLLGVSASRCRSFGSQRPVTRSIDLRSTVATLLLRLARLSFTSFLHLPTLLLWYPVRFFSILLLSLADRSHLALLHSFERVHRNLSHSLSHWLVLFFSAADPLTEWNRLRLIRHHRTVWTAALGADDALETRNLRFPNAFFQIVLSRILH